MKAYKLKLPGCVATWLQHLSGTSLAAADRLFGNGFAHAQGAPHSAAASMLTVQLVCIETLELSPQGSDLIGVMSKELPDHQLHCRHTSFFSA